jgi:hypothetical protein
VCLLQGWRQRRPVLPSSTAWAWCHPKGNKHLFFRIFTTLLWSNSCVCLSGVRVSGGQLPASGYIHRGSEAPPHQTVSAQPQRPELCWQERQHPSRSALLLMMPSFFRFLLPSPWQNLFLSDRLSWVFRHCCWLRDLPSYRVWFLPLQPCRHQGKIRRGLLTSSCLSF